MDEIIHLDVSEEDSGLRLDVFLAEAIEDASRSFMKKLIREERVQLNGQICTKASRTVNTDNTISVELPPVPPERPEPEDIPLEILYQDAALLIINKPSGLVVHPAPGHAQGTLVNAVLHHCSDFQWPGDPSRPGIVHRLDRDTSGVMVVAKTMRAFNHLSMQASEHRFDRRYLALVRGEFPETRGRINASIGRSLADRGRMAVTGVRAREAATNFEVLERFGVASLVGLQLDTGRTHQIRVHMRFAGRPVIGDPVYGVTDFHHWAISEEIRHALEGLQGQALHAERLGIEHPITKKRLTFEAPPPADFQHAWHALRTLRLPVTDGEG